MQTTAPTRPVPELRSSDEAAQQAGYPIQLTVHLNSFQATTVELTHAELAALVQQAHDRYDITGVPF